MKTKAILSTTTELEVPFFDVDSMRVVWHGNYVKYFEMARCELLKEIDYNYLQMEASGYAWPIVDMRIKYVASAKLCEFILIEASLIEYESRIRIDYIVREKESGKVLTKGHTIQVAVEIASGEMSFSTPTMLSEKMAPYIDK